DVGDVLLEALVAGLGELRVGEHLGADRASDVVLLIGIELGDGARDQPAGLDALRRRVGVGPDDGDARGDRLHRLDGLVDVRTAHAERGESASDEEQPGNHRYPPSLPAFMKRATWASSGRAASMASTRA